MILTRVSFYTVTIFFISCVSENDSMETKSMPSVLSSLEVSADALTLLKNKGLVYLGEEVFTGRSVDYYTNKSTAETIEYQDGKMHGHRRKYFEDGTLSFESYYKAGKQSGSTRSWWRNGNLRSESNIEEGKGQGVQMQYYQSGAKFKRRQLKDGKEFGLQQSWRENGKIYNNYEIRDGRIFGLKRASLCFSLDDEIVQLREN